MAAKVIIGRFITTLNTPLERVLEAAIEADLDEVVVVGYAKDGSEYFASSTSDGGSVLWHFERAKHRLMQLGDDDD